MLTVPKSSAMAKHDIPIEVRRFILTSIPSVPHAEALILVHSSPPRQWSARELAQRLYVSQEVAQAVLGDLCKSGMLQVDEAAAAYWFDPQTSQLGQMIEDLSRLYRTHLVEITLLIHARLDRKAQQFADAFNLRKDS
jgi:hypothetical protein